MISTKQKLKNEKTIRQLFQKNKIEETEMNIYKPLIDKFINSHIECPYSNSLQKCKQNIQGYEEVLSFENGRIYETIIPCGHTKFKNVFSKFQSNFLFKDFDLNRVSNKFHIKKFKNSNTKIDINLFLSNNFNSPIIKQLDISEEEFNIKQALAKSFLSALTSKTMTGAYIYGDLGIGKTTLMQLMAVKASELGKTVAFSTLANLSNEIKQNFNDHNAKDVVSIFKNADIIFIDDIAGEKITEWLRDEILFNILNYRMINHKLTYFSSNKSMKQLSQTYELVGSDSKEAKLKTKRLMERIYSLCTSTKLNGAANHRLRIIKRRNENERK